MSDNGFYFDHRIFSERADKLVYFLKKSGWKVGEDSGLFDKSSMSKYRTGKSLPSAHTLFLWAANAGVNLNWLLLGEGEMLRSEDSAKNTQEKQPEKPDDKDATIAALKDELLTVHRKYAHALERIDQLKVNEGTSPYLPAGVSMGVHEEAAEYGAKKGRKKAKE